MPKKVLVTGGAGYIGAHTLVELVKAGIDTVIVDDLSRSHPSMVEGVEKITGKKLTFYQIDCSDRKKLTDVFVRHRDIDSIIHFAAFKSVSESVSNPLLYYRNNLGSLINLLEVMRDHGTSRFIFSSSCTVYGQPDAIPVTEEAPFKRAESAYGATKQMSETILEDAVRAMPTLQVISLRYFNPIGAHPSGLIGELPIGVPSNLVPFITQTAVGKRAQLTVFGNDYSTPDGSCLRDFIHVVDLAKAHVHALQLVDEMHNRFEAINVGTGQPVSVLELVSAFTKVTGKPLNYVVGPRRAGDIEKIYAQPEKAWRVLKWKAQLSMETALKDAWNWEKRLSHATD
ncbi:MAG: UDP-glucose 4-epimerase GalE [Bacteroidetes bacterium]|nr:UDP-glucose 4-epimerase GalE [Bacteroidota bacterium]